MTNLNKGLKIAEKIIFTLALVLLFVCTFLPATASSTSSSATSSFYSYSYSTSDSTTISSSAATTTFASLLNPLYWALFFIGYVVASFSPKKYYAIGVASFLAQPIYLLTIAIQYTKLGIGGVLLIVGAILALISIALHLIGSATESNDVQKIDAKIGLIKVYKDYKDEGVITEEEFQSKKNELLNIKAPNKK